MSKQAQLSIAVLQMDAGSDVEQNLQDLLGLVASLDDVDIGGSDQLVHHNDASRFASVAPLLLKGYAKPVSQKEAHDSCFADCLG